MKLTGKKDLHSKVIRKNWTEIKTEITHAKCQQREFSTGGHRHGRGSRLPLIDPIERRKFCAPLNRDQFRGCDNLTMPMTIVVINIAPVKVEIGSSGLALSNDDEQNNEIGVSFLTNALICTSSFT